ncbi:MAG: CRTAC1 family protein [Sedimentisphaerales bacterium]|nr:CRTAC1 family protein [Sedimentisphaerales bacterium]
MKNMVVIVFLVLVITGVGRGEVRFVDRTEELIGQGSLGGKAAWGDFDDDGWVDILAGGALWVNDEGRGFTRLVSCGDGVMGDYDNDGYLDVFCYGSRRLWRNVGGVELEEQELGDLLPEVSRGASWGDHDGDGDLDLYVGGYEVWPDEEYADVMLENYGGSFGIRWEQELILRARGITSCDFDADGDIDIYVSNYRLLPNLLWVNDGTGVFWEEGADYGVAGDGDYDAYGHTIGSAWGDFDNDGDIDLFVGNFSHPADYQDRPKFYRNMGEDNGWRFEDVSYRAGLMWQESYASPALGDYDNDGDLDLYFTTVYEGDHAVLYRNDGRWRFRNVTEEVGLAEMGATYQAAWADFDNDGDLDLATAGRLWVNEGNDNHWLKVRLAGDGETVNRWAIGAQVRIELGDDTLTREVEAGTGEGNQNDLTLHFGLGDWDEDVDLEILWPGGERQRVNGVAVDQTLVVDWEGI